MSSIVEDVLDREREEPRETEGDRQARVELARLDRVDRLSRHPDTLGQLRLGPAAFRAQLGDAVLHRYLIQPTPTAIR
jgi:hypothetical protein